MHNLIYFLFFITLAGFNIIFLNAETILTVCFLVFFYIITQNSNQLIETLDVSLEELNQKLHSKWIQNSTQHMKLNLVIIKYKILILLSILLIL